jgi:glycosyltransferase involved in cell wall biosynthesis
MDRNKLVFISSVASPHQIRFCEELQKYFDATFLFYDQLGNRPKWWQIELPASCHVLKNVWFKKRSKYLTFSHLRHLNRIKPDILMLGGFSLPANYIAYRWAKFNNVKTIVYTERSRNKDGVLRKKDLIWSIIHFLYRNVDLVVVSAEDSSQQFEDFGFKKVVYCPYATDLANYFSHPIRTRKSGYTYLFPNRLTAIYNPIQAIDIFYEIYKLYPTSILQLNAQGELYGECVKRIEELSLNGKVVFLNKIESWEDMHLIYKKSDILIFPALFSNGNYTIIEAMASGMGLVISNKILGLGTIIKNNYNGFNCEPETSAFVESVKRYIDHPELFNKHCIINRDIAFEYSAEGVAELFNETLRKNLTQ